MNRRGVWLAGVAVAAGAAGFGVAVWRRRTSAEPLPPDFWDLRFERPEGGELVMAEQRGKPLLLNFWATWCPPCVTEMPMLDAFHRAHSGARGWQVVGLAVDSPTPVREFLRQKPVAFAIGLAGMSGVELTRRLGNPSGALPFTVVVGADGQVRERKLGALGADDLAAWAAA